MLNAKHDEVQIALYQEWPGAKYKRYNVTQDGKPTKRVSIFPATKDGLDQAIKIAERHDAILVKLTQRYFTSADMFTALTEKIRRKEFVRVFQAVGRLPEK